MTAHAPRRTAPPLRISLEVDGVLVVASLFAPLEVRARSGQTVKVVEVDTAAAAGAEPFDVVAMAFDDAHEAHCIAGEILEATIAGEDHSRLLTRARKLREHTRNARGILDTARSERGAA